MKLSTHASVNEAVLSNVGSTGEFRIRNSAKAFSILSDKLYSNKIKAIIRELSCNALDSHAAANKTDVPFEVHLPTMLEPWFSVKDFGLGLSHDQVLNIYTTYFESTKTESNEFIGALGLGSKSPFSYTENFTVTSVFNGTKRIYSAFINNEGVPSIVDMSAELTDEPNGVEVKFSVVDKYEYSSFRSNAQDVFTWFKNRPVITGVSDFTFTEPSILEKDVVPGIHLSGRRYESYAVMGNICYPLGNIPEAEKRLGDLNSLLEEGIILEFDIGDLDFAPSREQLSYIPSTIASIKSKLEILNASLVDVIAQKVNQIATDWEKSIFLSTQYKKNIYRPAILKYVADTKFELFDERSYGEYSLTVKQSELKSLGLTLRCFKSGSTKASSIRAITVKDKTGAIVDVNYPIYINKDCHIVLHDLKVGCYTRAQYHFLGTYSYVFYIESDAKTSVDKELAFTKFLNLIKNPTNVIRSSALKVKPVANSTSSSGILVLKQSTAYRRSYYDPPKYVWAEFTDTINPKDMYYYVTMSGFEADINGLYDVKKLREDMEKSGLPELKDIKIYGVRKSRIGEISKKKNWKELSVYLRSVTAKVDDKQIAEYLTASYIDNYRYRIYNDPMLPPLIDDSSPYKVFYKKYMSSNRNTGSITALIKICSYFGKTIEINTHSTIIENERKKILNRYPLLKHIDSSAVASNVATYIKLIDQSDNSTSNINDTKS